MDAHNMPNESKRTLIQETKEILAQQNSKDKAHGLEYLMDVFEYERTLNETDVIGGVQLLLAAALRESDPALKETFFRAINTAIVYQHVGDRINWDALAAAVPTLAKAHLEYVLSILGLSGQANYLPLLQHSAYDPESEMRTWATEDITELE